MNARQALQWIFRLLGTSSLFALIFVAAPHAWMDSIHASLGLGRLPDLPIVGYLTRSLSAFYALVGGLFWVVSYDLERHRRVVVYLGAAVTVLGVMLLAIDVGVGLPRFWTVWEGPFVIVFGVTVLLLSRRLDPSGRRGQRRGSGLAT